MGGPGWPPEPSPDASSPLSPPLPQLTSVMMVLESEDEERTACKLAVYNLCPAAAGPAEVDRCAALRRIG